MLRLYIVDAEKRESPTGRARVALIWSDQTIRDAGHPVGPEKRKGIRKRTLCVSA